MTIYMPTHMDKATLRETYRHASKTAEEKLEPHTPERYCTPNEGLNFARLHCTAHRELTYVLLDKELYAARIRELERDIKILKRQLAQAGLEPALDEQSSG